LQNKLNCVILYGSQKKNALSKIKVYKKRTAAANGMSKKSLLNQNND